MEDFNPAIEKRKIKGIICYAAGLLKISPEDLAQLMFCFKHVFANNKQTQLFWEELLKYLPTIKEN